MPSLPVVEENVQKHLPPMVSRGIHNGQDRDWPDNRNKAVGEPVCYYCTKRGHIMAKCQILENKSYRSSNVLVTSKGWSSAVEQPSEKRDRYSPFISTGYAYFLENSKKVTQ